MRTLNILCGGGTGGVEVLCRDYGRASKNENDFLIIWRPGIVSDEMIRDGLNVEVYNTSAKHYLRDFIRFLSKCKKRKYDVILCHQIAPLISIFMLGVHLFLPNIKIIAYAHSNAHDWDKKSIYSRKIVYKISEKIICISKSVQRSVAELFNNDKKLQCIYNGIPVSNFSTTNKHSQIDKLNIIYVGRLIKEKGVDNIIREMAALPEEVKFELRIIGDGPERVELEKYCDSLKLNDKISFLGSRRDTNLFYSEADIFIHLPNWQEGFGITVIEAMAAQCICIVNNHGALHEIVEDGVNGYVVEDNGSRSASDVIKEIWNRKEELTDPNSDMISLRERAALRANDFSIENFAKQLDTALEK